MRLPWLTTTLAHDGGVQEIDASLAEPRASLILAGEGRVEGTVGVTARARLRVRVEKAVQAFSSSLQSEPSKGAQVTH